MKIAVGTTRKPKIEGVQDGVKKCPYFEKIEIEYIFERVPSDISDTPLSIDETMLGAKNRANNLKKAGIKADFYIGIEGGTTQIGEKKYLFGTIYIENENQEGHYGFSPFIEVPKYLEKKLYEEGAELGKVMGELSGRFDIRSENGTFGTWSDDMLNRKDQFLIAFQTAIAPFYNKYYKI